MGDTAVASATEHRCSCNKRALAAYRKKSKAKMLKTDGNKESKSPKVHTQQGVEKTDLPEKDLETYMQASQRQCLLLCQMVLNKLPREIRDQIYEYLVTPDYVYVGSLYLDRTGDPCENDQGAHFWDQKYVGPEMRTELAQTWYRVSLFFFWERSYHEEVIVRFMGGDRWGMGIKPNDHLSRVRFDVGDTRLINMRRDEVAMIVKDFPLCLTAPLRQMYGFHFPNRVLFLIRIHTLNSIQQRKLKGEILEIAVTQFLAELRKWKSGDHRFVVEWSEIDNLQFNSSNDDLDVNGWLAEINKASEKLPEWASNITRNLGEYL